MQPTAVHTAQVSGWFDIWRTKLFEASGVVILFTNNYRQRFNEGPLIMEAKAIERKCGSSLASLYTSSIQTQCTEEGNAML
jgi:hypothetical protein